MNKLNKLVLALAVGASALAAVWGGGAAEADEDRFRFADCSVEFILQDGRFVAVDGRSWAEVDPTGECHETAENDDTPADTDTGGAEDDSSRSASDEANQQDNSEDGTSSADSQAESTAPTDSPVDDPAPQSLEQLAAALSRGPPSCTDAVKLETGPALISFVDNTACVLVRSGGAVQVSRGDYTLHVTLPAGRDWEVTSRRAAFVFSDLTTRGRVRLNAADGVELSRYDSTSWLVWSNPDAPPVVEYYPLEEGLPALLDAIAASATVPAAE